MKPTRAARRASRAFSIFLTVVLKAIVSRRRTERVLVGEDVAFGLGRSVRAPSATDETIVPRRTERPRWDRLARLLAGVCVIAASLHACREATDNVGFLNKHFVFPFTVRSGEYTIVHTSEFDPFDFGPNDYEAVVGTLRVTDFYGRQPATGRFDVVNFTQRSWFTEKQQELLETMMSTGQFPDDAKCSLVKVLDRDRDKELDGFVYGEDDELFIYIPIIH